MKLDNSANVAKHKVMVKVTPKRNYYGAYGYSPRALRTRFSLVSAGREACALGVNLASAEPDAPHNS